MDISRLIYRVLLKATALFFGLFSAFNTLVHYFGKSRLEDIWWIDSSWLSPGFAVFISILAIFALLSYALIPLKSRVFARILGSFFLAYSLIPFINTLAFYKMLAEKTISSSAIVPFSAFVFLFLLLSGIQCFTDHNEGTQQTEYVLTIVLSFVWVLLFPLAQIQLFGNTDYSRKADAAVVFGARYYGNGRLSTSLKNRLDKGIELLAKNKVDYLILTGGVDADGIDETEGMLNYVTGEGVRQNQIIIDNKGKNTDLSVSNTIKIAQEYGFDSLIAVSHDYHLPRIKMAYRAMGMNVYTSPAISTVTKSVERQITLREIPGFWVYYFRSALRDISPAIVQ